MQYRLKAPLAHSAGGAFYMHTGSLVLLRIYLS